MVAEQARTPILRVRMAIPATVWILVGIVSLLMEVSSELINTLPSLYLARGVDAGHRLHWGAVGRDRHSHEIPVRPALEF